MHVTDVAESNAYTAACKQALRRSLYEQHRQRPGRHSRPRPQMDSPCLYLGSTPGCLTCTRGGSERRAGGLRQRRVTRGPRLQRQRGPREKGALADADRSATRHRSRASRSAGRLHARRLYTTVRFALQRYAVAQAAQGYPEMVARVTAEIQRLDRAQAEGWCPARIARGGNGWWCGVDAGMPPAPWDGTTIAAPMGWRPPPARDWPREEGTGCRGGPVGGMRARRSM